MKYSIERQLNGLWIMISLAERLSSEIKGAGLFENVSRKRETLERLYNMISNHKNSIASEMSITEIALYEMRANLIDFTVI